MERDSENRKLLRSTLAVSIPTLFSRVFGYLRDMLQAKFLGAGAVMDAFSIAFLIPNLLRRLTAEGSMTAAFVPVFTQLKKEESKEKLWRFANIFFFDLTLILTALTILGIIFAPALVKVIALGFEKETGELTVLLTRIMFPYIFLVSLAALAMAILNSFHKFFVPAFTPVLFNLAIITLAVLLAPRVEKPVFVFAAGILVGGALQLGFQIPFVMRQGMRFRPVLSFVHPAVRKVGRLMVPGIFGAGIYQINIAVSRILATTLPSGSVSWLYYSGRVQELTLGLFSVALSIALLPTFSDLAAAQDIAGLKRLLKFSLRMIFFITFPATVGLIVLNRPIIHVLFERGAFTPSDTVMVASCLLYFALGIPFLSGVKVLASAFFSLKDTRTPVVVAFFIAVIYIGSALVLMQPLQAGGIALALSISSLFNGLCLFFLLERKIGRIEKGELLISLLKSALMAGLMGGGIWLVMRRVDITAMTFVPKAAVLLGAVMLGLLLYGGMSAFLSREELSSMKNILSRRKTVPERRGP